MTGTQVTQKQVLIVEDDAALNRLYGKYLEKAGHHVTGLRSLSEALVSLKNGVVPDVLILDIGLSDGNGTSLLDLMCCSPFDRTKVIVVSGNFLLPDMSSRTDRIDYMLIKPISARELMAFVNAL
jgi:DNA-binding response OmpR family regulator